ncbi:MAG: hypothetical protein JNK85_19855 [Verrucomicrobiales bacterium]|nr:hypothetical protein [Verrucomicrobiales bacterium]
MRHYLRAFLAAGLVLSPLPISAASLPYFDNFDDDPVESSSPPSEPGPESGSFLETINGQPGSAYWNVFAGSSPNRYYQTGFTTASTVNLSAALEFPGLVGGSFAVSTQFAFDTLFDINATGGLTVGLGAAAESAHFSSGARYELSYVLLSIEPGLEPVGTLRIEEFGSDGRAVATSNQIVPVPDVAYTLTFWGTRTSAGLVLKGELLASNGALAVVSAFDDTPLGGAHFGYSVNAEVPTFTNVGINAKFDDFLVTVPEPSTPKFFVAGLLLLTFVRPATRNPSITPGNG